MIRCQKLRGLFYFKLNSQYNVALKPVIDEYKNFTIIRLTALLHIGTAVFDDRNENPYQHATGGDGRV